MAQLIITTTAVPYTIIVIPLNTEANPNQQCEDEHEHYEAKFILIEHVRFCQQQYNKHYVVRYIANLPTNNTKIIKLYLDRTI
mgnify:CR=1